MRIKQAIKNRVFHPLNILIISLLLVVFCCPPVLAETGYVSDMLLLTMRTGPGDRYPVIKTLTSNTAVEILEKKDTYFRVRSKDGDEGWVQGSYIIYDLPAALVVDRLKKKIEELEKVNSEFVQERSSQPESVGAVRAEYKAKHAALESSLEGEVKEKNRLAADLDKLAQTHEQFLNVSKDSVALVEENKTLKEENLALTSELKEFKDAGTDLLKIAMLKWFLAGAGVLVAGWIVGRSMGGGRKNSRF
ncbi:MAG: TIGR04211 family SH3 domain-containing protein [Desulfobacterium sp.]|jgi:SH3 domain protein|nr:TIGR04211 family SH3 domain-containing protein [Desulfobacterium sp.]